VAHNFELIRKKARWEKTKEVAMARHKKIERKRELDRRRQRRRKRLKQRIRDAKAEARQSGKS